MPGRARAFAVRVWHLMFPSARLVPLVSWQFAVVNLDPIQLSSPWVAGPSQGNEGGTAICPVDSTNHCHNNGKEWCECTTGAPSPPRASRVSHLLCASELRFLFPSSLLSSREVLSLN